MLPFSITRLAIPGANRLHFLPSSVAKSRHGPVLSTNSTHPVAGGQPFREDTAINEYEGIFLDDPYLISCATGLVPQGSI